MQEEKKSPIKTLYRYKGIWFNDKDAKLMEMLHKDEKIKTKKEQTLKEEIIRQIDNGASVQDIYNLLKDSSSDLKLSPVYKYEYLGAYLNFNEVFKVTKLKFSEEKLVSESISVIDYNHCAFLILDDGEAPSWEYRRYFPETEDVYKAFEKENIEFLSRKHKTKNLTR